MRRITVFADEEDAREVVLWLEEQGLDFMSEDYAGPVQRRDPPPRRQEPERHEPPNGVLTPLRKPLPVKLSAAIERWLNDGSQSLEDLVGLAADRGWSRKKVRDTLRRMQKSGKIGLNMGNQFFWMGLNDG
jgi:hypothetical protein